MKQIENFDKATPKTTGSWKSLLGVVGRVGVVEAETSSTRNTKIRIIAHQTCGFAL
jgi:hypothetical protein